MLKHGLALSFLLAAAPAANAGLHLGIELIPQTPGPYDNSVGPVDVTIDMRLTQRAGSNIPIRLLTFDFYHTDPKLEITRYEWDFGGVLNLVEILGERLHE